MSGNRFGRMFGLSAFGEPQGLALGALVEGCPAGVVWQQEMLNRFMDRCRLQPTVEVLSGLNDNITLGTPIGALVYSSASPHEERSAIPNREIVGRVIGGGVARMMVTQLCPEVQVIGFVSRVGLIGLNDSDCVDVAEALEGDPWQIDEFSVRCPNAEKNEQMELLLSEARKTGESFGGVAFLRIAGLPRGLGQPMFHNLKSDFTAAFLSMGGAIGVEIGQGFEAAKTSGHEFHSSRQDYGGIRGGVSTGDPITIKVAFKPALEGHEPCLVPAAIPVLEAMTWLVLADQILMTRIDRV